MGKGDVSVRGLVLHYVLVLPVLPAVFLDDIFCDASSECAGMTFGLTDFTTKLFSHNSSTDGGSESLLILTTFLYQNIHIQHTLKPNVKRQQNKHSCVRNGTG